MADASDVANALAAFAAQTLYPNGTSQPSSPTGNPPCIAYQGWPDPNTLDVDLPAGKVHVSVFPRPEEKNTSRFPRDPQQLTVNTPTLAATIAGQQVTIAGSIPAASNPTNVSILANGQFAVYAVQTSDTLTSIATALAALAAAFIPGTTSAGAVITFAAAARIAAARVGVGATQIRELRRQEKLFQVSVWAGTPALRDAVSQVLDVAFAKPEQQFITMTDTFGARLVYHGTRVIDDSEKANLYRRDLLFMIEYATTDVIASTQVTQEVLNVTPIGAATSTSNL